MSFNNTKSSIVGSALGIALGMSTNTTWEQLLDSIIGVTNNGDVSKTFTPSTSSQSYTIPKGYHNGNGKVTCNTIPVKYQSYTFSFWGQVEYFSNDLGTRSYVSFTAPSTITSLTITNKESECNLYYSLNVGTSYKTLASGKSVTIAASSITNNIRLQMNSIGDYCLYNISVTKSL